MTKQFKITGQIIAAVIFIASAYSIHVDSDTWLMAVIYMIICTMFSFALWVDWSKINTPQ